MPGRARAKRSLKSVLGESVVQADALSRPVCALDDAVGELRSLDDRKQLGLDQSLWVQYVSFTTGMLQGDFGKSWYEVPFLWAESYFYRKLLDAVGFFGEDELPELSRRVGSRGLGWIFARLRDASRVLAREFPDAGLDKTGWWDVPVPERDLPVVQGCALVFAATYILLNLLADIVTIVSNPRLLHPR